MYQDVLDRLLLIANPQDAKQATRFFKAGKGEYAEGDQFLGIRNPVLHKLVREYKAIELTDICKLLNNPYHEARHLALLLMVYQYERGDASSKQTLFECYVANTDYINNWDLVDCSCYKLFGPHLHHTDKAILYQFASSDSLWERRIAMVSTLYFIRHGEFDDVVTLAKILLRDKEDLIHKAVGWMLREAGNRKQQVLLAFLNEHYNQMPRTMLRYAIEKLPEATRQAYLNGLV